MRIAQEITLVSRGGVDKSASGQRALEQIRTAIDLVRWPPGSDDFRIYPESGKRRGEGSGVRPIRDMFVEHLQDLGWEPEAPFPVSTPRGAASFGAMDAAKVIDGDLFIAEWETGNISSSHRSLNKLAVGVLKQAVAGGVLIVPTRELAQYLTDRIGNLRELEPYFDLWSAIETPRGLLLVMAVEHDEESWDVPRIRKGTDGRALA